MSFKTTSQGWPENDGDFERIQNECERFGVGLLYFSDPKNYDTFEVLVEPERKEPALGSLDGI